MYRSRLVYRKTESMCIHEGLNKNLSQRINTTRSDREYEICHTELNAMCNCHDSSGRLLPLRVWGQPAVAAGLRTSKQRRDEWEVGESMKINLNLYLFLTPSNLSHASDVQKDLAPFTMTPCTRYNSKKLKEEIWRALGNMGPSANGVQRHPVARCQQGEPADQPPRAAATRALWFPPSSECEACCFTSASQISCTFLLKSTLTSS